MPLKMNEYGGMQLALKIIEYNVLQHNVAD